MTSPWRWTKRSFFECGTLFSTPMQWSLNLILKTGERNLVIGGFYLTSSPPCWCTEQKRKKTIWELDSVIMQTITRHLRLLCAPTWMIENHLYFQSGVHFVTSTLTGMCHIHCGTRCDIVNIVCVSERCMCTLLKKESLLHANDQSLGTSASLLLLYSDCCPWIHREELTSRSLVAATFLIQEILLASVFWSVSQLLVLFNYCGLFGCVRWG